MSAKILLATLTIAACGVASADRPRAPSVGHAYLPPGPDVIAPVKIAHDCVIEAAAYYSIPPEVLVTLRIQEGGTLGRTSKNKNGTEDHGPTQVNTVHLKTLAKYGVTKSMLTNDECVNLFAGAWVFHNALQQSPNNVWKAIGNYHSANEPFHSRYRKQVSDRYRKLSTRYAPYFAWLRANAEMRQAQMRDRPQAVSSHGVLTAVDTNGQPLMPNGGARTVLR